MRAKAGTRSPPSCRVPATDLPCPSFLRPAAPPQHGHVPEDRPRPCWSQRQGPAAFCHAFRELSVSPAGRG